MEFLKALKTGDFSSLIEAQGNTPLEPLELSELEKGVIIARMKKLAKDPSFKFPNALDLVHRSYQEQDWERQSEYGDFVRPRPSDKKASEQYEEMIQNAVQLLSKYRGIKGDWRTDRFVAIPTNDRSSMGSMTAASIGETYHIKWDSNQDIIQETSTVYDINEFFQQNIELTEVSMEDICESIYQYCNRNDLIPADGTSSETNHIIYIYDLGAELVDTVRIRKQ